MKHYQIEQNTERWLQMRAGKLTMSKLACVMANYGKAFGEPAKRYATELAIEQITGKPIDSDYQNEHMQRGHEQEPIARSLYESSTFQTVTPGGFFCDERIGASSDGLIGDNGLIEIKSVMAHVHFSTVKRNNIDPAYKWQIYGTLWFTNREWLDFVSYCSCFPADKQLFIYRVEPETFNSEFSMIEERIKEFFELVNEAKRIITDGRYT